MILPPSHATARTNRIRWNRRVQQCRQDLRETVSQYGVSSIEARCVRSAYFSARNELRRARLSRKEVS